MEFNHKLGDEKECAGKGDRKGQMQDVMLSFTQTGKRCQIEEGDCVRLGGKV